MEIVSSISFETSKASKFQDNDLVYIIGTREIFFPLFFTNDIQGGW